MSITVIILLSIAAWIICAVINVATIIVREGIKSGSARLSVDNEKTTSLINVSIALAPIVTALVLVYLLGTLLYGIYTGFLWLVHKAYLFIYAMIRLLASIVDFAIKKLR